MKKYLLLILLSTTLNAEVIDALAIDKDSATSNGNFNIINLNAVQTAFNDSSNTDNIKICKYSERTICKVRIRERMPAVIQLPKYDSIKSWVLGDTKNFMFDVLNNQKNRAVLRGIYPGSDTNLIVIGESGFIYSFYIRIDSSKSKFVSDFIVNIQTNNKHKNILVNIERNKRNSKTTDFSKDNNTKQSIAKTTDTNIVVLDYLDKKNLVDIKNINLNFKQVSGDKALMPFEVFDDGIWTYFKYGDKDLIDKSKLPVVYAVVDGFDMPVNSRVEGGYLILETTNNKWTIRSGSTYACVQKI